MIKHFCDICGEPAREDIYILPKVVKEKPKFYNDFTLSSKNKIETCEVNLCRSCREKIACLPKTHNLLDGKNLGFKVLTEHYHVPKDVAEAVMDLVKDYRIREFIPRKICDNCMYFFQKDNNPFCIRYHTDLSIDEKTNIVKPSYRCQRYRPPKPSYPKGLNAEIFSNYYGIEEDTAQAILDIIKTGHIDYFIPKRDCNNCTHLDMTEEEQKETGANDKPHICNYYHERVYHRANMPNHDSTLYPVSMCSSFTPRIPEKE